MPEPAAAAAAQEETLETALEQLMQDIATLQVGDQRRDQKLDQISSNAVDDETKACNQSGGAGQEERFEAALQHLLREIDSLQVGDGQREEKHDEVASNADSSSRQTSKADDSKDRQTSKADDSKDAGKMTRKQKGKTRSNRKEILSAAQSSKQSWISFQRSRAASAAPDAVKARPAISFRVSSKPNKRRGGRARPAPAPAPAPAPTTSVAPADVSETRREDAPPTASPRVSGGCIRVVVDTCELVCPRSLDCIRWLGERHRRVTSTEMSLEVLECVIPRIVWHELDGLKKHQDNAVSSGSRSAVTMLLDSLSVTDSDASWVTAQSSLQRNEARIRMQLDQRVADDEVLACALHVRDVVGASDVVVLITSDKVLTGKAMSDGLRVFRAAEFRTWIERRDEVRRTIALGDAGREAVAAAIWAYRQLSPNANAAAAAARSDA